MQKGKKRVHRLVVLPDYQGIGIGTTFIKEVAKMVSNRGFELNLTTTTPSLIYALKKDPQWVLGRFGRCKGTMNEIEKRYGLKRNKNFASSSSQSRITFSFWFKCVVM